MTCRYEINQACSTAHRANKGKQSVSDNQKTSAGIRYAKR